MNVISGGGLVGIVSSVGKNYARVRAIIDDESSVSVSFANTSDTAIASGDLKLITKGYMNLTEIPQKQKFQKVIWLLHQELVTNFYRVYL